MMIVLSAVEQGCLRLLALVGSECLLAGPDSGGLARLVCSTELDSASGCLLWKFAWSDLDLDLRVSAHSPSAEKDR